MNHHIKTNSPCLIGDESNSLLVNKESTNLHTLASKTLVVYNSHIS
jgi:hypothetical protein